MYNNNWQLIREPRGLRVNFGRAQAGGHCTSTPPDKGVSDLLLRITERETIGRQYHSMKSTVEFLSGFFSWLPIPGLKEYHLQKPQNQKISVIIPALNEESNIGGAISRVLQDEHTSLKEVIVVDGGSSDKTVATARKHGALVSVAVSLMPSLNRRHHESCFRSVPMELHLHLMWPGTM